MSRNLKNILCELACYVIAFSPAITGSAGTAAILPILIELGIETADINESMSALINEVKTNDEFIAIRNQALDEIVVQYKNKEINDKEFDSKIEELHSDKFVLDFAVEYAPYAYKVYKDYEAEKDSMLPKTIATTFSLCIPITVAMLGQVCMWGSDKQKEWINKGKKIAGKEIKHKETESERVIREYGEVLDRLTNEINQYNELKNKPKNLENQDKQLGDEK